MYPVTCKAFLLIKYDYRQVCRIISSQKANLGGFPYGNGSVIQQFCGLGLVQLMDKGKKWT
jgi:hypothetical protein